MADLDALSNHLQKLGVTQASTLEVPVETSRTDNHTTASTNPIPPSTPDMSEQGTKSIYEMSVEERNQHELIAKEDGSNISACIDGCLKPLVKAGYADRNTIRDELEAIFPETGELFREIGVWKSLKKFNA